MTHARPTTYTVYPDGYSDFVNSDRSLWTVRVELSSDRDDLWSVRAGGSCYNRRGIGCYERQPSSRTDRWLKSHRFPLDEAIRIAARVCAKLVWCGCTAQEASDYVADRNAGAKS